MRAAPPRVLLLLLLVETIGLLTPVQGLCKCAARFASSSDVSNATSIPLFDNFEEGETIVFSSAAFHCNSRVATIRFSGVVKGCGHCQSTNHIADNTNPILQLWRMNDTFYNLNDSVELQGEDVTASLSLGWFVEPNDVIGLWIPPSCDCSRNYLRVGYLYGGGGSRVYHINGDLIDSFNPMDYELQHGPLPMISVETDDEFDVVCIIGLPAGALIAVIALCFTLAGICWSISVHNKKRRKTGDFNISQPLENEQQQTMELNEMPSSTNSYNVHHFQPAQISPDTSSRRIYQMPLPPIPTNIDDYNEEDDGGTRSLTGSPRPSYQHHTTMPLSMSNPDLTSAHRYGNIIHGGELHGNNGGRNALSLEREPHQNIPQPRISRTLSATGSQDGELHQNIPQPRISRTLPATGSQGLPPSPIPTVLAVNQPPPPVSPPPATISNEPHLGVNEAEQSYDRDSEYEIPDDESSDDGKVFHEEYMNLGELTMNNGGSPRSDDVYY